MCIAVSNLDLVCDADHVQLTGANCECNGHVWRMDVGMSGGVLNALPQVRFQLHFACPPAGFCYHNAHRIPLSACARYVTDILVELYFGLTRQQHHLLASSESHDYCGVFVMRFKACNVCRS